LVALLGLTVALAQKGARGDAALAPELEPKVAENLILDPSFENELADWQRGEWPPGAEIARDDRCASEGKYSLRIT